MTAPDKIWTAPTDGKCHVGFDTKSMNYTIEYTRTALAQAAVAAAYEAAANKVDNFASHLGAEAFMFFLRDSLEAGRLATEVAKLFRIEAKAIRALATPDQIAALAAERAAIVTVNPLVWEREAPYHVARVFGGHYSIENWDAGSTLRGTFASGDYLTFMEAKAAAKADYDARIRSAITITNGDAEITRLRAVIAKDAAQMIEDQHKMHKAAEALREVIDFACALNNVAAGQNPEQLDRWSAALAEIGGA